MARKVFREAKVGAMRDGERERFALCLECGGRYSADRADYFLTSDLAVLRCCGEPCVLATEHCTVRAA